MLNGVAAEKASNAARPTFLSLELQTKQNWRALAKYLNANGFDFDAKSNAPQQFSAGFGNLNYLIEVDGSPTVLRRPPMGEIPPGANDMKREDRILSRLWRSYPLAPQSLHYCADKGVLGNHFLLMEYKPGLRIGGEWPDFLKGRADIAAHLGRMLLNTLTLFHDVDPAAVDLDSFGRPDGFLERTALGWRERMNLSCDGKPPVSGAEVSRWLERNQINGGKPTLLHNDFKLDNILLDPQTLSPRAILDWDQGTRGDPLFDLATLLSYWAEAGDPPAMLDVAQMPTHQNGFPTRVEIVQLYAKITGRDISNFKYYRILAMFKLSVVFMQIYAQYRRGTSVDQRFKRLGKLSLGLMEFAHDITQGRAD